MTIFDSQANFLNIYAFSVVHFNYPFIINVSGVVWTCLFTWIFIRRYKYGKFHIIGLVISLFGVGITLYGSLRLIDNNEDIFDNLKGLFYCLLASIMYSIVAILQEIYFKSGEDIYDYFPWLGIIGFFLTLIESFCLQEIYKVFYEYEFSLKLGFLWGGFSSSLVLFTSIAPFFIKRCSASMFNISLVSQIFWSYLVEVISGDTSPRGYEYYIGFVIIIAGIFVFNKYPIDYIQEIDTDEINKEITNNPLTENLIEFDARNTKSNSKNGYDNVSEHSSAFSAEKKYNYYRNPTLSAKANKYLSN